MQDKSLAISIGTIMVLLLIFLNGCFLEKHSSETKTAETARKELELRGIFNSKNVFLEAVQKGDHKISADIYIGRNPTPKCGLLF